MLKRTPLFESHRALGARLIDFGGWEMPVQYTSIVDEHHAVRNAAGIFDISHMGEVFVRGPGAGGFLNHLLTNDIRKLSAGKAQYSLMCNRNGGVVDDLYVYCVGPEEYLLIINASRIDSDVPWMLKEQATWKDQGSVTIEDASETLGAIAIQGPAARNFINEVAKSSGLEKLTKNEFTVQQANGEVIYIARTGYTGEDGFELVALNRTIATLWERALQFGARHGLKPAGLGARDTLRTEMCYPLYGHELNEETTPIEAGVGFFVALDKGEFNGREVLACQKLTGTRKKCVAFVMDGKSAPPRPDYLIWNGDQQIGKVVSGTQSPSLNTGIGIGYVPPEFSAVGTSIQIEIRGNKYPATIKQKPFYKKQT